jgi:tetratricopeptide (TPR) repeat protein
VRRACQAAIHRAEAGARLAAARAALRIGDWRLAMLLGRSLALTTLADRGWTAAAVAAWAAGRSSLADRMLRRVRRLDRGELASLWIAAEGAMLLDRQRSPKVAGADPTSGLLEPLTSHALGVLDEAVARHDHYADLHYHRGVLLRHLGLGQEASGEFDRALEINADYAEAQQARRALHG